MKKLLALLLLSPFVAGEDYGYEYPIDLTCEWGSINLYYHVARNPDDSWVKLANHATNNRSIEKRENKTYKLKSYKETKDGIMWKHWDIEWHLNRHTLKMTVQSGGYWTADCYKGFKEYNEKQI